MSFDKTSIHGALRQFIIGQLIRDPTYPLADDEVLFSSRLIDSFALAELAVFLESEFDVYIPDSDMTKEAMDTLERIAERVALELGQEV